MLTILMASCCSSTRADKCLISWLWTFTSSTAAGAYGTELTPVCGVSFPPLFSLQAVDCALANLLN